MLLLVRFGQAGQSFLLASCTSPSCRSGSSHVLPAHPRNAPRACSLQNRHVRSLRARGHRGRPGFRCLRSRWRGSPGSAVLRCRSPCKAAFYVDGACATIAPNSKRSCYSPLAERRGQSFPLASCTLMQDRNISSPARGAPCMFSGPFRRACAQADSAADCPSCPSRGRLLFGPSRSRFHATLWCKRVVRAFQQFSEIPSARRRTVAP